MNQSIQVTDQRVTKSDADPVARSTQIGYRAETLNSYARIGYRLAHTAVIDSEESVTFVDTLTRDD